MAKEKTFLKKLLTFSWRYLFFSFLYFSYYNSNINFSFLSYLEAKLVNLFFNDKIIDYPSMISGNVYAIYNEKESKIFVIDRDCLGINIWFLLLVFVFSYPLKFYFKKRIIFIVFSFFFIELLNIIRLVILYYLFINNYKKYIVFHEFILQIFEVIILIILLIVYLKFLKM